MGWVRVVFSEAGVDELVMHDDVFRGGSATLGRMVIKGGCFRLACFLVLFLLCVWVLNGVWV